MCAHAYAYARGLMHAHICVDRCLCCTGATNMFLFLFVFLHRLLLSCVHLVSFGDGTTQLAHYHNTKPPAPTQPHTKVLARSLSICSLSDWRVPIPTASGRSSSAAVGVPPPSLRARAVSGADARCPQLGRRRERPHDLSRVSQHMCVRPWPGAASHQCRRSTLARV